MRVPLLLEENGVGTRGSPGITRKLVLGALTLICALSGQAPAQTQATGSGRTGPNPATAAEVHIAPTTLPPNSTDSDHTDTTWMERGYDLKTILAELYDVDESRIEFSDASAAFRRYDITLVVPREESEAAMDRRIEQALQQKLHLAAHIESRSIDVYVVRAPRGPGTGLKPDSAPEGSMTSQATAETRITGEGTPSEEEMAKLMQQKKASTGVSLSDISITAGTVTDLCRMLERGLDRPVIDESHLTFHYDAQLTGYGNRQGLFDLMRSSLGLVVTPERRQVAFLVVRPA